MPIRTDHYTDEELPPDHREALFLAIDEVVDECFEDVAAVLVGADFADTSMADYLPPKYLPKYTPQFAKQILTCILTVAWKLNASGSHKLACVAEELALAVLIERATNVLEEQENDADFSALEGLAYEARDFELLFAPQLDGIEDTADGSVMAMAHLHFEDWFTPFQPENPAHPYVEPEEF